MDRRRLVKSLGLGVAATSLLSACSKKQTAALPSAEKLPEIHWKLVTSWPKNFPGLGETPEKFAQLMNVLTEGRFQIKVYGAGELVPALEVFDAVSQGTAAMGHSAAYYWKGKIPASVFFTTVPFGLTTQEMNGWIYYGGGEALWQKLYAPFNLIPMTGGSTGTQMAGWFNKEINAVTDLKGLKMRIPGLGGDVLQRLGGTPVSLPGGEIFTSLQSGVIDATEWVGPYNDKAFSLQKAARFYYYPGWHEPGAMLEFTMNKTAHDALPKIYQTFIKTAVRAINADMLDEYTARNNLALEQLMKEDGIQLRKLPDDVLRELKRVSEQVVAEIAQTSLQAKAVYDSYIQFRKNVVAYHEISEKAYLLARDL